MSKTKLLQISFIWSNPWCVAKQTAILYSFKGMGPMRFGGKKRGRRKCLGGRLWEEKYQFSSVHSLSCVRLFATPWITAHQASLSITNSRSSPKLTSESMMPSSHFILCHPFLLLPPIPSSIRVFSNESTLRMRWPNYWSFSFSISPSKEHLGLISFRMDWWEVSGYYKPAEDG